MDEGGIALGAEHGARGIVPAKQGADVTSIGCPSLAGPRPYRRGREPALGSSGLRFALATSQPLHCSLTDIAPGTA
jgi:hypothetical protein